MVDNYFQIKDNLPLSKRTPALKQKGERQHQIVQQFQPATKKIKIKKEKRKKKEKVKEIINLPHVQLIQTIMDFRH